MDENAALQDALAAEHAVIWGYGVVGAAVSDDVRSVVRDVEQGHRTRRGQAEERLRAAGVRPVDAAPSYELPFPVTDQAAALRLAVQLEDGCAASWHYLLGNTDNGDLRATGLDALTACAVQAVRWRQRSGVRPLTVVLPGQ